MFYPDDVFDKFEEVSYLLKDADKTKINKFLSVGAKADNKTHTLCKTAFVAASTSTVGENEQLDDQNDQSEKPTAGKVSNLFADFEVFEWAGVSFGSDELFRLQQSLVRLSVSSKSDKLRVWGKLYGTHADYYVAEGFVQADDESEKAKTFEDRGTGTNQFVYWVTNSPLGVWTMLPDIKHNL